MWKRRRFILVSLVVILLGAFAWLIFHNSEPVYQGKPLTFWLKQLRENDAIDPEATTAIRAMGVKAIPTLLSLLGTRDTKLRRSLIGFSKEHHWFPIHPREAKDSREMSVCGFIALGPNGKVAVPDLIRYLGNADPGIRAYAAFCLSYVGPAARGAVPALMNRLTPDLLTNAASIDAHELEVIAMALGEIGPAASEAVPKLVALSNDPAFTRVNFAKVEIQAALIKIRADSLDPLIQKIRDTSDRAHWLEATCVAMCLRTEGEPAVPALIDSLSHTNPQFQMLARGALRAIHARPDLCIPAMAPSLQSTNSWSRGEAIELIRAFGPTTNHLGVPEIIKCLSDPDPEVQKKAARALKQIDPETAARMGLK